MFDFFANHVVLEGDYRLEEIKVEEELGGAMRMSTQPLSRTTPMPSSRSKSKTTTSTKAS
jgi:hypothetical protein